MEDYIKKRGNNHEKILVGSIKFYYIGKLLFMGYL